MHPWNQPVLAGLRQRLESLPHALLIHGPKGVGKRTLAETIAQLVLCEADDRSARPCNRCEACRWFLAGNHPDFRRVEPEALAPRMEGEGEADEAGAAPRGKAKPSHEIKIDQVRALAGFLNVGSHRGRRRVALVHPVEDMNLNAANALLKGLEEPPGAAMFVLVSHRPARLLPTIRSRCVAVPVPRPPAEAASAWLAGEAGKEAARWLAFAGGSPLLAQSYAADPGPLAGLIESVRSGRRVLPDTREELEALAEVLQKYALDQAMSCLGLTPIYGLSKPRGAQDAALAYEWLTFARSMGPARALARHPLNPRLFAAELQARVPRK